MKISTRIPLFHCIFKELLVSAFCLFVSLVFTFFEALLIAFLTIVFKRVQALRRFPLVSDCIYDRFFLSTLRTVIIAAA